MRGVGKQILFEEDGDYRFFLNRMRRFSDETGVAVCTYCLMENHVHLLLRDREGGMANYMKKLAGSYARFFNEKYERVGHLFQERYKSEIVDSEAYFCTVVRYILRNPEKAGICLTQAYRWSSFTESRQNEFVDMDMICDLFDSRRSFEEFVLTENADNCLEFERRPGDQRAMEIIRKELKVESGTAIQSYSVAERNEAIRKLLSKGISMRRIERLTGVGRGIIQRVTM